MKRFLLLAMLLSTFSLAGVAQNRHSLTVDDIFNGKLVPRREMKRTTVQGDRLSALRLSEFRSVQFEAEDPVLSLVSSVISDAAYGSLDKETEMEGNLLTYAFITLDPSSEGLNRYLGYSLKTKGGKNFVTVIVFSGQASAEELKKKLIK